MDVAPPAYVTPAQAQAIGLSPKTLRKFAVAGHIAFRVEPGVGRGLQVRYSRVDVELLARVLDAERPRRALCGRRKAPRLSESTSQAGDGLAGAEQHGAAEAIA
jgi:hypothetical protein